MFINHILKLFVLVPFLTAAQFNFYGPKPFGDILETSFVNSWVPNSISSIENNKYIVIVDYATQTKIISVGASNIQSLSYNPITTINGANATYGTVLNSIFQVVDENTNSENDSGGGSGTFTPLSGLYKVTPLMHSYYNMNSDSLYNLNATDGGSFYMTDSVETGYVLIKFEETADSVVIKAEEKWVYNTNTGQIEEVSNWVDRYLMVDNESLVWTTDIGNASAFMIADATEIIDIEIDNGSDFNPLSVSYQTNATAAIPSNIESMENSGIVTKIPNDISPILSSQLGNSASAAEVASQVLDIIEASLTSANESLRYPKEFYIELRENMLSHSIESSDIYNARIGNHTVEHIYFTNESDSNGIQHPFMVIASYATSARPNFLIDVNRPPGAEMGVGYAQSTVTRNGKLGEFLIKIPLKDYGLVTSLLENDLSAYGDLASDYDSKNGNSTIKDVYNYTSLASIGVAVDGVTIYPAKNNNLRFAVEDAEVTSSGIHVGGGLELHYHADGHSYNGNGINIYNYDDYLGKNHPPVIGVAFDGIALFGKYENSYSSMIGSGIVLDDFGGHNHGDTFGYHYHAHTRSITSSIAPNSTFDAHILLVGAWKGNINAIPGFLEVKGNQLKDNVIGPFAGSTSTIMLGIDEFYAKSDVYIYPNPVDDLVHLTTNQKSKLFIYNNLGQQLKAMDLKIGVSQISLNKYREGLYYFKIVSKKGSVIKELIVK